jgi:DNA polymerase-1
MECTGVPINLDTLNSELKRYRRIGRTASDKAVRIVSSLDSDRTVNESDTEFNLSSGKQLQQLIYTDAAIPVRKRTKPSKTFPKGQPSTDADTLRDIQDDIGEEHWLHPFLSNLLQSKDNEKSADTLESYKLWSKFGRLHPTVNLTGTRFTRQSSSNPNLQNVSTGKETDSGSLDHRLRSVFGPRRGRLWLALDYSNIELRLWAFDSQSRDLMDAFEQGISLHLVIARALHPELEKLSDDEATRTKLYKKTKNGNFSLIYGASPTRADATYGKKGCYKTLVTRFPEVRKYTERLHREVQKYGYIETMTGYRLHIPKDEPHKAVSGRIQGTAGAIIGRAMVDCSDFLRSHHPDSHLLIQVHDELVFDTPDDIDLVPELQSIMMSQGDKIGIPLPVGADIIRTDWANGVEYVAA